MAALRVFPVLFFFFIFPFSSSSRHSFHDDRPSLLAFKTLITSDPFHSMANWNITVPLCNWSAVTCSHRHPLRAVTLNLTSMDLSGSISPSLGNLSFLHILDLSGNALSGNIPTQLGRLFRLRELALMDNHLEGNIPNQLSGCKNLDLLGLSSNHLRGNIPRELGSLKHLQWLDLGENNLTGIVPSSLGNLSALVALYIDRNSLSGAIPPQLGLLSNLQWLLLNTNELTGNIPISLSNISTLIRLEISTNKLIGSIPHELGLLINLQFLYLQRNDLSGSIPISLSNISTIIILGMNQNKLTGSIPTSLSNIFNLEELFLWGNQLSGKIPTFIGNCSKLKVLDIGKNKFTGSVPLELGKLSLLEKLILNSNQLDSGSTTTMPFLVGLSNCSHLHKLEINDNKLSGVLPLTIGKLFNLNFLSLSRNMIQGNIPLSIGNISSLTFLNLSENLLNGSFPLLVNLKMLERLYLSNNMLQGTIPNNFEQLQHLGLLDISGNMLSGKIPNSLASLKQLRILILHHNQLSGSIPANLGKCINLELLDLSHNMLTRNIPPEIVELYNIHTYLNLSWNLLEGSLPKEIGKLTMAQAIDISMNHLSGVIPLTLGSCIELQSLNLSRNSFQGGIPDSLTNLQNLMNLDLSSNFLSSTIPISLIKLKMLQYLNLSFNNLVGEIPKGGFFANRSIVISLIGNPSLCGPQVFRLSACPGPRSHFSFVKKVILPVSGAVVFILCCLLLGFLWRGNMHMQSFDFSQTISQMLKHPRISYQELHIATNGFTEANLLGTGSVGLVYKGILNDGTHVAIKVFQLQNEQVERSFKVECSVLQKVRHRNLVRIITSCSNLHFKGLVFEFMSNGSLEKHLYPNKDDTNGEDVCELGLKARLDIAIDVAHAIEYLHYGSFVQVVHCDIKPNNILLDEDMVGHVTDFGIARLIGATSSDSLTSTLSLKGSIGYIAPEYGLGVNVSTHGDVYSYGILLLEMITRKQPTSNIFVADLNLHKWVNLAFPNRVKEVIDCSLFSEVDGDDFEENKVYKCLLSLIHIGLLCSKDSPNERPTMRDVVKMLETARQNLMENAIASNRLRQSISNLIGDTNATMHNVTTLDDQSSSTF